MMDEHIVPGDPPIRVLLRRSTRARRYSLRVSRLDGRVTLTMPQNASRTRAIGFLRERTDWLRGKLAERAEPVEIAHGVTLPVAGRFLCVVPGARSRVALDDGVIEVSRRVGSVPGAVAGLLKELARDRLASASDGYARALGQPYTRLTLRDPRSRWGSCSADRALMYSWRLILAPPEVLDYVCAHEAAHLVEMNHGPRFWALVGRLCPGHEVHRVWLRENGEQLHRYRFST